MHKKLFLYYVILLCIIFVSCEKESEMIDGKSKANDPIVLKEKELELKEKEIELKEKEQLKEREESVEQKEKELKRNTNSEIYLSGKYSGSIKDGTYWEVFISNFDGRNFEGYNVIYWKKYPNGFRTSFKGEFNPTDNSIIMYEDINAKGSGTFYGNISSEGNIAGKWKRYSDGGKFTWNLRQVN